MARLSSFSRELSAAADRLLSPAARSRQIANLARRALGEAQEHNRSVLGYVPDHDTFVDHRRGAPLESVDPDRGVIVFAFELQLGLFAEIGRLLVLHSPVLTGEYQDSHRLYADGVEVSGFDPKLKAEEWVFASTVPYARKIERGQSDQAPDGVYEAVAALASNRYKNLATIRFSYRNVIGGGREDRQPAIVVSLR